MSALERWERMMEAQKEAKAHVKSHGGSGVKGQAEPSLAGEFDDMLSGNNVQQQYDDEDDDGDDGLDLEKWMQKEALRRENEAAQKHQTQLQSETTQRPQRVATSSRPASATTSNIPGSHISDSATRSAPRSPVSNGISEALKDESIPSWAQQDSDFSQLMKDEIKNEARTSVSEEDGSVADTRSQLTKAAVQASKKILPPRRRATPKDESSQLQGDLFDNSSDSKSDYFRKRD